MSLSSRALGTLVHRLLAEARLRGITDEGTLAALAPDLADDDEIGGVGAEVQARAVVLCRGLMSDAALSAPAPGTRFVFEAPYSRRRADGLVERGAGDCLAVSGDGVTVLEFKTGQPRADDERQLAAYVEAMRGQFPGRRVDGRVVYVAHA